ncbi:MAG: FtsQ-type POTRA domain-containing protein [Candidatus Eisenbacteria bacterium]
MSTYQGRALQRPGRREREGSAGPWTQVLRVLVVMLVLGGLAMLPWKELRRRHAVLTGVEVKGLRYLDVARVRRDAAVKEGEDLIALDLAHVRRRVEADPRIARAEVRRHGLRGLTIEVTERIPTLVVTRGEPFEVDSSGVLLEPLQRGVVADVPLLTGVRADDIAPGEKIASEEMKRGLAWAAILSDNALRLSGQVSELDVSESRTTRLVLMNGIRVVGPAWPVSLRQLSGLRATLLDLQRKGTMPGEVDVRIPNQVIVRDTQPVDLVSTDQPHSI